MKKIVSLLAGAMLMSSVAYAAAPTVTSFTIPTSTVSPIPVNSFTATDSDGTVTAYMITETSIKPLATAAGWSSTVPLSYTTSKTGSVTLYAWAKDNSGTVSTTGKSAVTSLLSSHNHPISQVTGLVSALASKVDKNNTSILFGAGTYEMPGSVLGSIPSGVKLVTDGEHIQLHPKSVWGGDPQIEVGPLLEDPPGPIGIAGEKLQIHFHLRRDGGAPLGEAGSAFNAGGIGATYVGTGVVGDDAATVDILRTGGSITSRFIYENSPSDGEIYRMTMGPFEDSLSASGVDTLGKGSLVRTSSQFELNSPDLLNLSAPSISVNGQPIGRQVSPPISSSAPCKPGDFSGTNLFVYVCISENSWVRSPVSAW